MINYLDVLSNWMKQPHYLLFILIITYAVSAAIDFLLGTMNSILTKNDKYETRKAQLGIVKKLALLALMIIIIPLAMILPGDTGIYSLTVLYLGIVVSEIYSIMAHIGLVKDNGKHKHLIATLFISFLQSLSSVKDEPPTIEEWIDLEPFDNDPNKAP